MEAEHASILWQAIPIINAQERLNAIEASCFPNLKQSNRSKIENRLNKIANVQESPREATWDDLAREIGQAGLRATDG